MRRPVLREGWLHDERCFGCGPANPDGLGLTPRLHEDGSVSARFVAAESMAGPPGIVHGGMLAVPTDCVASWAAMHHARRRASGRGDDPERVVALTGSYTVRLDGPAVVGEPLELLATPGRRTDRTLAVHVDVRRPDGRVLATFDGVFVDVELSPDDAD